MGIAREPGPGRLFAAGARLRGMVWTAGVALVMMLVLGTVLRLALSRAAPSTSGQQSHRSDRARAAGWRSGPGRLAGAQRPARVEIIERRPRRPRSPLALTARDARPRRASDDPAADTAPEQKKSATAEPLKSRPAASEVAASKSAPPPPKSPAPQAVPAAISPPPPLPVEQPAAGPDTRPEPEDRPEATYPQEAAAEGVTGTVRLKVVVDRRGLVEDALVVRSSGDQRLDEAAEAAVRRWRYRPAQREGRPIRATDYVEVEFYRESSERDEE